MRRCRDSLFLMTSSARCCWPALAVPFSSAWIAKTSAGSSRFWPSCQGIGSGADRFLVRGASATSHHAGVLQRRRCLADVLRRDPELAALLGGVAQLGRLRGGG